MLKNAALKHLAYFYAQKTYVKIYSYKNFSNNLHRSKKQTTHTINARLAYAPVVPIVFLFITEQIILVRIIDNIKTTVAIISYIPPS